MAAQNPEFEEAVLQACLESENPVEFFRQVARDGKVGVEEFRLIMETPFRLFLQQGASKIVQNVASIPGFQQIEGLVNESIRSFHLKSNLILQQLFRFFDRDGDGLVSEGEIVESLTILTRRDFRGIFKVLDLNGDGFITETELLAFVGDLLECGVNLADTFLDTVTDTVLFNSDVIRNALSLVWMFIDSDGDGAITPSDLTNQIPPPVSGQFEMMLAAFSDSSGLELTPFGPVIQQIISGEAETRKKFEEAAAQTPDGQVSEARMYAMLLDSTRSSLREQLPAQLAVGLATAPIPNKDEVVEVLLDKIPRILESRFPALFRAMFNVLDKDCDGRISQKEFDSFYTLTKCLDPSLESGSRVETLIGSLLGIFDVNMDGKVTLEEAESVIKGLLKVVRELIHVFLAVAKETAMEVLQADPIKAIIRELGGGEERISLAAFQQSLKYSPLPRAIASMLHIEAAATPPVGAPDPFLEQGDNA